MATNAPLTRAAEAYFTALRQLGGYQVLKKWLSYREHKVLDRPLSPEEVQHFSATARRIAAILQLVGGR